MFNRRGSLQQVSWHNYGDWTRGEAEVSENGLAGFISHAGVSIACHERKRVAKQKEVCSSKVKHWQKER